nr:hypothetical protein [Tanacetum cinerariifolium]
MVSKTVLLCLTKRTMCHDCLVFFDDELTKKELKQIEADDQAIQTILLGLPEDIYAAVDCCKSAQEIWLRVQQMMKGFDIGIQEKKAKLFNEWERYTSNDRESIESYYHRFLKLMNDLKRNKYFSEKIANYTQLYDFLKYNQKEVDELKVERLAKTQDPLALMATSNNPYTFPVPHQDQPSFNQNYMQQPIPNLKDITDPTTAMNIALALMAKAFKLNYSTPTNNNQRISSNPRNRQIAQSGIQLQAKEFDLMADAADLDEIEEYLQNEHYALWEVIEFGDSYKASPEETGKGSASESSARKKRRTVAITIMTVETHNWSYSADQELHKIVKDENFPIVNQVDARLQNFKIQFFKEAAKFVGDFKSLAKEADESLAKHKALELEIERLLKAVVSSAK